MLPPFPEITPAKATHFDDTNLFHIFYPGSTILLLGMKDSGKTQLSLGLAQSFIDGDTPLPIFSINSIKGGKVLYVEGGEYSDEDELQTDLDLYDLNNNMNFLYLYKKSIRRYDFCKNFDLNDDSFLDGIFQYLLDNQCRLLILDNLKKLLGASLTNQFSAN